MQPSRPKAGGDSNNTGDVAYDYARSLLNDLGVGEIAVPELPPEHPAESWARSGAMSLTGNPEDSPVMCPVPVVACVQGAARALAAVAGRQLPPDLDPALLLGERAAIARLHRRGAVSVGGSCRLLRSATGWVALNLPRVDDWALLPALFFRDVEPDWDGVAEATAEFASYWLIERGRELGLALAECEDPNPVTGWYTVVREQLVHPRGHGTAPFVVDLSSLWAGPLCGHLLAQMGARVIKVESPSRPDGARSGPAAFFDLLNAGKQSVALDLKTQAGCDRLRALIRAADIVIESSRPRALEQLGLFAEDLVAENPGLCWVSITGYGRTGDAGNWIAFGDDAGVAAGLSAMFPFVCGHPILCADAIGDPLTGLHAALVALARWKAGRGGVVSVAMRDIVHHCIAFDVPGSFRERSESWLAHLSDHKIEAAAPKARRAAATARPLGADTNAVLEDLGLPC